jgi:hypothetical protein
MQRMAAGTVTTNGGADGLRKTLNTDSEALDRER